ncbi:MAG: hypothetical protein SPL34_02380, partial [Selenomonadaceae bacterium]|nr:hypothetical protein [Selenomonadaceae bacterium]
KNTRDSLRRGAPFVNQLLYITSSVSACQELFEFIFASSQDHLGFGCRRLFRSWLSAADL